MLFETQAKADNFIRYNGDDILEESGKAPVRSYYCEICGGYHVTSNPSVESGELLNQRDRRLIEAAIAFKKKKGLAHEKDVEEYKVLCASLHKRLEKVRALLLSGELADAEDLLDICGLEMEALYACRFKDAGKSRGIKVKIEKMADALSYAKEAQGASGPELPEIDDSCVGKEQRLLSSVGTNIQNVKRIDLLLACNDTQLAGGDVQGVAERLAECRNLLGKVKKDGKKIVKRKFMPLIERQEALLRDLKKKQAGGDRENVVEVPKRRGAKPINYEEYRTTLLSLIERLEKIKEAYEAEDYDFCETSIGIGYFLLDDLQVEDDNTDLIKRQFDRWREVIDNL